MCCRSQEKLITIEQGNFQILLATGQLLGEGFDLPILDALVLAYPFSPDFCDLVRGFELVQELGQFSGDFV